MKRGKLARPSGQVLIGVVIIMVVAAIMVPMMVFYAQREAVWSQKQADSTTAFHLAEAGLEKGYLAISLSTTTWAQLQKGVLLPGYEFDTAYTDVGTGGEYAISITSGPDTQEATIESIGRDKNHRETRTLKAVYANALFSGTAIYASGGVEVGGGVTVEWGAIMSPQNITLGSAMGYPQFWSAGGISPFDTNPAPPNCDSPDCCQWHAYSSQIPSTPALDFQAYISSAQAATSCPVSGGVDCKDGLNDCCYFTSDQTWKNVSDSGGRTYYIDGGHSLTLQQPGIYINGNVIITGNLNLPNGNFGNGNVDMYMPTDAWKQYCGDWSHYQGFDSGAPATFPGINSNYKSSSSLYTHSSKVAFQGLVYVGGVITASGGGGQGDIYGSLYAVGTASMTWNSGATVYYNKDVAQDVLTTKIQLSRQSWQEEVMSWPLP